MRPPDRSASTATRVPEAAGRLVPSTSKARVCGPGPSCTKRCLTPVTSGAHSRRTSSRSCRRSRPTLPHRRSRHREQRHRPARERVRGRATRTALPSVGAADRACDGTRGPSRTPCRRRLAPRSPRSRTSRRRRSATVTVTVADRFDPLHRPRQPVNADAESASAVEVRPWIADGERGRARPSAVDPRRRRRDGARAAPSAARPSPGSRTRPRPSSCRGRSRRTSGTSPRRCTRPSSGGARRPASGVAASVMHGVRVRAPGAHGGGAAARDPGAGDRSRRPPASP